MNKEHELGKLGEELAANYLKTLGFTIIDQNWRNGKYEVDIVCVNETNVVFVEVKTHNSNQFFDIRKLVDREKRRKMTYCANNYVRYKNINLDVRFDIIIVTKNKEQFDIEHIPDAFYCAKG